MSRRMDSNASRPRSSHNSTRTPLLKLTMGAKSSPRDRRSKFSSKKTIKHTQPPTISEGESSTSGDSSDDPDFDEQTDDADDESEDSVEPEVFSPSHFASLRGGAGVSEELQSPYPFAEPDTWTGFPDSETQDFPDWINDEELKKTIFDSDDDQVYERVNEVSDSENENEEDLERAEAEFYEAQLQDEFNNPWASHFANQIDGMSAYGFGDEDSGEESNVFAFSGSDDLNDTHARRVHFEEQSSPALEKAMAVLADSPTISRSLLPAALQYGDAAAAATNDSKDDTQDDDYDSDATVELAAPAEAWRSTSARDKSNVETSPPMPAKRPSGQKGPVRGTFEDDGDKVTAILDSTGKKLLLSDPHLLGGVFARRFGPSVPGSPSVGFSEAVFGESDSSQASSSPRPSSAQPLVDLMLPGLTSGEYASTNGHATGLPEAFLPIDSTFLNEMCPRVFDHDDTNDPEDMLKLQDMIAFDVDNESEDPDSRTAFPSISAPATPLAHLNHMNVSAFKRRGEATYIPHLPNIAPLKNKHLMSPSGSSPKRKRRSDRYESPYKDAHYHGVTPVQRMAYQEHPSSPAPSSSVRSHKRRKTMW